MNGPGVTAFSSSDPGKVGGGECVGEIRADRRGFGDDRFAI
jgi:hypothetical protein